MTSSSFYVIGWKFKNSYIKSLSKKYDDEDKIVEFLKGKLGNSKFQIVYPQKYYDSEPFDGGYECFLSLHTDNNPIPINKIFMFNHIFPKIFEEYVISKEIKIIPVYCDSDRGLFSNYMEFHDEYEDSENDEDDCEYKSEESENEDVEKKRNKLKDGCWRAEGWSDDE